MLTGLLPRDAAPAFAAALEVMPVVVIVGLRQSGKSTFLQSDATLRGMGARYITLDDFAQLEAARADPEALLEGTGPLIIDEAQRAPELLVAVKRAVDRHRRPGRFVLSGSADFRLLAGVTESLAGRAITLAMRPLTRRERHRRTREEPVVSQLLRTGEPGTAGIAEPGLTAAEVLQGGLPPAALARSLPASHLWLRGYEQTYLERDVRQLARLEDFSGFRTLLHLSALRTAQLLNVSDLARDAKMNATTTARYLSTLEASFVVQRLPPFLANKASRLVKSPKLFIGDSGLAAHLAGVEDISAQADEPMRGPLYETWMAQELASLVDVHLQGAHLTFWNVQGRHEVDFVIQRGRRVIAIEVKATSRWTERDLSGLRAFLAATPDCLAAVLAYGGADSVRLGERLWALPMARVVA